MSRLESIIAKGNRSFDNPAQWKRDDNWITCADGYKLSVIAGAGAYCVPRTDLGQPEWPGPFSRVEVGYPSATPEPWDCPKWIPAVHHDDVSECEPGCCGCGGTNWQCYFSGGVYPSVPVDMVRALVALHGGER